MQRCSYCGRENEDRQEVCHECGARLDGRVRSEFAPRSSQRHLRIVRILVLAGLAFLVLAGVFVGGPKRVDTIVIRGTPRFRERVASSLTLLRAKSLRDYQVVTNYIGAIVQAKHSGMSPYQNPPTLELNDRTVYYSITWCAASIAHDSIHSKLYLDYLKQHPDGAGVPDEIWTGAVVERRCCEHETRVLQALAAPPAEISWSAETNDRYWEIDYSNRNW